MQKYSQWTQRNKRAKKKRNNNNTGFSYKLGKKSLKALHYMGTGLCHTVIFHHKKLKMGHCLWHVLSSLATLHLTRSKTKKEKKKRKGIFTK